MSRRVSFGLFASPTIILFYVFFVTVFFFSHVTWAQSNTLTLNTENDLKIIQTDSYIDGTILMRLTKQEQGSSCNEKILRFNIIDPDGISTSLNVENHPISQENFCSTSNNNNNNNTNNNIVLIKRHPECDGAKSKTPGCCTLYPDLCKDPDVGAGVCNEDPNKDGCGKFCQDNPGKCTGKAPAKTPDTPKTPEPAKTPCADNPKATECATDCSVNPYGPGCNVDCGTVPTPSGCANIPDCGQNPNSDGCKGPALDCAKYPSAPECNVKDCSNDPNPSACECANNPYGAKCSTPADCGADPTVPGCSSIPNCAQTPDVAGCNGALLDCNIYPRAPECKPDCSNHPDLPKCNDCTFNPNASGCEVCKQNQNQQPERCEYGYCDKHPDVPECSFILADSIKIYAVKKEIILVTYYCNPTSPTSNNDVCGILINWDGFVIGNVITFEKSCSDGRIVVNVYEKGFIYTCYKSESKEIYWTTFGAPNTRGEVSIIKSSTLTNIETFSFDHSSVFAIEDGGYGIVAIRDSTIYTIFILKGTDVKEPYQIYKPQPSDGLHIYVCNIAYQSSGYSCIIQVTRGNQQTIYEIDFLSDGTVIKTTTVQFTTPNKVITYVEPLNFGGYVFGTKDFTNGTEAVYIFDNKGGYHETLTFSGASYTETLVLSNDTIIAVPKESSNIQAAGSGSTTIHIESTDQVSDFTTIEGGDGTAPGGPGDYGSAFILSTSPSKGSVIDLGMEIFTVIYTVPITVSTGSISIFRVNGTDAVLKQSVPATDGRFVKFENDTTVTVAVLKSTLNTRNVPYYVAVDSDFVKEKSNNQNVIGIRENIWNFTTSSTESSNLALIPGGGYSSAIIRLTADGTKHYTSLSTSERIAFVNIMNEEFARSLPCEPERLSTTYGYQYAHTKDDQIIMRVDIREATSPNQPSPEELIRDLDETVTYKDYNSLADGASTSYLDASNGAPGLRKLWPRYWGFLLAAIILLIILFILFFIARHRNKDGRNFLAIFLCELLQIDLALDIAFIALHGKDYKWTLPATLFFLLFPILLNIIFTNHIIKEEKKRQRQPFNKWWKKNKTTANAFRAASYLDTDALQILSSRAGRIEQLSAPFSEEGERSILYKTALVALLEDLPQFIIYVVYLTYHIKWAIVPILVTITCILVLIFKLTALICYSCCYKRKGKEPNENDKEQVIGSDSSSNSSTTTSSSEEEETPAAPDGEKTSDIPTGGVQRPQDGPPKGPQREPKTGDSDTLGNIPSGSARKPQDGPQDGPQRDREPKTGDSDTFGNIPSGSARRPQDGPQDGPQRDREPKTGDSDTLGNIPSGSARRPDEPQKDKPQKEPKTGDSDIFGNLPSGILRGPQDGPKNEPKSGAPDDEDNDKPIDKPISPVSPKKEPKTSSVPPDNDDKSPKDDKGPKRTGTGIVGGFAKKLGIGKKPKKKEVVEEKVVVGEEVVVEEEEETTTSNIKPTKDIKDSTAVTTSTDENVRTDVPIRDSTMRESTIEQIKNNEEYLKSTERESLDNIGIGGSSNAAIVGVGGYPGYSGYSSSTKHSTDKLTIIIGAAISGVTAADGEAETRYLIITNEEKEEKEEKDDKKNIEYIKTTTTKTSSVDGERYITIVNDIEYITIFTNGRYVTKSTTGGEEYTTTLTGEQYITKTTSGEEFITTITTTIDTTETTTTTTSENKKYFTKSASGESEYVIITSYTIEEFIGTQVVETIQYEYEIDNLSIITGAAVAGVTVAGGEAETRYLIITDEKEEKDNKNVEYITSTTTKTSSIDGDKYITKTNSGKEYITIYAEERYITKFSLGDEQYLDYVTIIGGDDNKQYITKIIINEVEYEFITTITTSTITTTTSTATSDDRKYITKSTGEISEYIIITTSNIEEFLEGEVVTETVTYVTEGDDNTTTTSNVTFVTEGDNTTTRDVTHVTSEGSSRPKPRKKPTRTNTRKFTEGEIEVIIDEVIVTDDDGKTTTTETTTRKDKNGRVLGTSTNTKVTYDTELVTEPEGNTVLVAAEGNTALVAEPEDITTEPIKVPSVVGPSIYQQSLKKKGEEDKKDKDKKDKKNKK